MAPRLGSPENPLPGKIKDNSAHVAVASHVSRDTPRPLKPLKHGLIGVPGIKPEEISGECEAVLSLTHRMRPESRQIKGKCQGSASRSGSDTSDVALGGGSSPGFLSGPGSSSLEFFEIKATKEDFMVVSDFVLDFSRHSISETPNFRGLAVYNQAVQVSCHPDEALRNHMAAAKYKVDFHIETLLNGKLNFAPDQPLSPCARTETRPTIFFTREGTTGSLWHNMMEHLGLYLTMALESRDGTNDFQVVIMDGHHFVPGGQGPGNLVPLIEALTPYPVLDSRDFHQERVCFTKGIFAIAGWRSYFWKHAWGGEPCPQVSEALLNFKLFALQGMGIDPADPPAWPRDVFRIFYLQRPGNRRGVRNQEEFAAFLKEFQYPGFKVEVIVESFTHSQTFKEQVELVRNCDVLISPHGAGLTNILFGREGNLAVIELFNHEHAKAAYFRNLALHLQMIYDSLPPHPEVAGTDEVKVDLELIRTKLTSALDKLKDSRSTQ